MVHSSGEFDKMQTDSSSYEYYISSKHKREKSSCLISVYFSLPGTIICGVIKQNQSEVGNIDFEI